MVVELGEEHFAPPDDPEIRWATSSDLDALARFQGRPVDLVRARMESGVRTVIAVQDGRLIGAIWYNPRSAEMDDWLRFTTAPGTVWAIGTRVAPDYRGQHLFRRMARLGMSYYARAGYSRVFGWIEALNRNSLRASAGVGSIVVGRVLTFRMLGLSLVYFDGSLHLGRWHANRVLELRVDQPRLSHPRYGAVDSPSGD